MWVLKGKGWLAAVEDESRIGADERDSRDNDLLRDYECERGARTMRADIFGAKTLA